MMERLTPKVEYLNYAWLVARKRKRLMLAIGLGVFLSIQFFGYLVTPVWEGTTLLLTQRVSKQNLSVFRDVSVPVSESTTGGDAAIDLIPILTGYNMGYDIVREFHLDDLMREKRLNPPTLRDVIKNLIVDVAYSPFTLAQWLGLLQSSEPNWTDKAAEEFTEDWIDVESEDEGTAVINVTVYGESPAQATALANGMADLLIKRTEDFGRLGADASFAVVAGQTEEAEANLKTSEEELARFQAAHGIYDVQQDRQLLLTKIDQFRTDLLATRRVLQENATNLAALKAELRKQPEKQVLSAEIARNPLVTQLESMLAGLQVRRAALLVEKSEEHPDVRAIQAEIERNQLDVKAVVQQVLQSQTEAMNPLHQELIARSVGLEVESATLGAREREISRILDGLEAQMSQQPPKEMEFMRLQQSLAINRALYDALKTRAERLAVEREAAANEYNIRILDRAYVPPGRDQDWPLWWLNILAGMLLGIVFGVGSAFVVEYWNEPVLSVGDVEQTLGLLYLGHVAELGKKPM